MKTTLLASMFLVATGVVASADHKPKGPDFVAAPVKHGTPRSLAASDAKTPIEPLDVVAFEFDSSVLIPSAVDQIDVSAKWLHSHPKYLMVVEGHTDRLGSAAYNKDLATHRAQSVRDELTARGIAADRIVLVVYGKSDATEGVNPNDRRVVMFASDRPIEEIVAGSFDAKHALAALWTQNGALFEQETSSNATPHEVVATGR